MQQPRVYIIILNYNNPKDTIECLESIYHQLIYDNFHVVLLDNSSTDDSECIFKNWQQENKPFNFTFIQTGANKGFAGGNNIGILFAQKQGDMDYVWILNNDTVVVKDTLLELVKKWNQIKISDYVVLYYIIIIHLEYKPLVVYIIHGLLRRLIIQIYIIFPNGHIRSEPL